MSNPPWLTIVGIGEDGIAGLSPASQAALNAAAVIMGPPRHLAMVPQTAATHVEWPVPFDDGLPILKNLHGQRVVVLASGNPFWFGVGRVIARHFAPTEWVAYPAPSTFALAAARLGWPLERTVCLGLHAAPMAQMRPHLAPGMRLIVLVRDGAAVAELATYLTTLGFGDSDLAVFARLGGPRERRADVAAKSLRGSFAHPVCVGVTVAGQGAVVPVASGREDALFDHDGQITKRPIRAITLSTLAPRPFEHLWDIGSGSGAIAIEWALAHPTTRATCLEARADRATRIAQNAATFGVADRVSVVTGHAPEGLVGLPTPQAVFVGGGMSEAMLTYLRDNVAARLVANAVTLETEAVLARWHARMGGSLMRIALSEAKPLGPKHGWHSAYPVVQWRVTL